MASNQLCGVYKKKDFFGREADELEGTYTSEGINKLCEGLRGSSVTSLKCVTADMFDFLLAPLNMHSSCTCACSLEKNNVGAQGGAALAEGLKGNSTLTSLSCVQNSNTGQ